MRALVRRRGLTVAGVFVVGLGIAGSTALFTLVQAILLRPLPYRDPHRLYVIRESVPQWSNLYSTLPANPRHFTEWRDRSHSFEQIAAIRPIKMDLKGVSVPEQVAVARVSSQFFQMLGVQAQFGRLFADYEDKPGREQVVVLADSLWRRAFGADPNIVGKAINLSDLSYTVVGILPPSFWFPKGNELGSFVSLAPQTEIFKPAALDPTYMRPVGNHSWAVIGRLKDGVRPEQAIVELNELEAQLAKGLPEKLDFFVTLVPLHREVVAGVSKGLWLLLLAMGAVLLMICSNFATVLLAQATSRKRDVAIQQALGAGRGHIFKQILAEAMGLALTGWVFGLALAWWALSILLRNAPSDLPRLTAVHLDHTGVLVSLLVAAFIGILFAIVPTWYLTHRQPYAVLQEGGITASESSRWAKLRKVIVSIEVSISAALLVIAGLLLHSYVRVIRVDKGFDSENVLTGRVTLPASKYKDNSRRIQFYRDALQRIAPLPSVLSSGLISTLPLTGESDVDSVRVEGDIRAESELPLVNIRYVSSDYFKTLHIPIYLGRVFNERDHSSVAQQETDPTCFICKAPIDAAVISQAAAHGLWPGQVPIGKRVYIGANKNPATVVGVVGDVRTSLEASPILGVYLPYWLVSPPEMSLVLRSSVEPESLAKTLGAKLREVDPEVPPPEISTMEDIAAASSAGRRYQLALIQIFAIVALIVVCVGIYGVISFSVERRIGEIGVRIAMGARVSDIYLLILRQGLVPVVGGLGVGVIGALVAGKFLRTFLFEVSPADPLTIALVLILGISVGITACIVPAKRASQTSPAVALRHE